MSEDLKAQFDAACLAGDYATQERLGPLLWPEPSAPRPAGPPTASPSAPSRDFAGERAAIFTAMQQPFADPGLSDQLMAISRDELIAKGIDPDAPAQPALLPDGDGRAAWRPDLPSGYTWDGAVVSEFEETAPGAPTLMHVAADALRSATRWHDPAATIAALEAKHGPDKAEALAEDATRYVRAYVSPKIQAALKAQGLFYHPDLIHLAASFWKESHRG